MTDADRDSVLTLNGLDDSRRALLELVGGMRRTLCLYTPLMRAELYDDAEVLAAIRDRVVTQPKVRFQLLLPPAREWRAGCPRLARLCARLTTPLLLRTPNRAELPDWPELGQGFAIADAGALLRWIDPRRLTGEYQPRPSERAKELLELFRTLWDRSQPDSDLRAIGL
jgi:hypothetical protein